MERDGIFVAGCRDVVEVPIEESWYSKKVNLTFEYAWVFRCGVGLRRKVGERVIASEIIIL